MSVNINVKNVIKRYGDNTVIPDLSLTIREGEFFTLLGPSGCGKTTLLRMIAGFNSIEGGDFFFNDTRINDLNPAKRNIGMVFQNYAIFPHMNVRKNVEFGLKNRPFDRKLIHSQADKFLKLMQIDQLADRMPAQLSGGQQQRVSIARAIVTNPPIVLADEPTGNLDSHIGTEIIELLCSLFRENGTTFIMSSHDPVMASYMDRTVRMSDGRIEETEAP